MNPKTIELLIATVNAAVAVAKIFKEKIPGERLLKKRPFPDRRMPHRRKRQIKNRVKKERALRAVRAAATAAAGAAEVYRIQCQPTLPAKYAAGGWALIGETGPEKVILPETIKFK